VRCVGAAFGRPPRSLVHHPRTPPSHTQHLPTSRNTRSRTPAKNPPRCTPPAPRKRARAAAPCAAAAHIADSTQPRKHRCRAVRRAAQPRAADTPPPPPREPKYSHRNNALSYSCSVLSAFVSRIYFSPATRTPHNNSAPSQRIWQALLFDVFRHRTMIK